MASSLILNLYSNEPGRLSGTSANSIAKDKTQQDVASHLGSVIPYRNHPVIMNKHESAFIQMTSISKLILLNLHQALNNVSEGLLLHHQRDCPVPIQLDYHQVLLHTFLLSPFHRTSF